MIIYFHLGVLGINRTPAGKMGTPHSSHDECADPGTQEHIDYPGPIYIIAMSTNPFTLKLC